MFADASPGFELDWETFAGLRDSVDSTLSSLWLWFCFRFKNEGTLKAPFTIVLNYSLRTSFFLCFFQASSRLQMLKRCFTSPSS